LLITIIIYYKTNRYYKYFKKLLKLEKTTIKVDILLADHRLV